MEGWIIFSLLCLLSWGAWGVVLKFAYASSNWLQVYFASSLTSFALALTIFGLSRGTLSAGKGLYLAALAGRLGGAGYVFFVKALETGKASVVIPLTALYPAVTVAMAAILLRERPSPYQAAGIILAMIASLLLSLK
jgi:transporter family protein